MKNIDSLFIDIQEGNLEDVKSFLGEDLNRPDNYGRTPLMNAAFSNQMAIVKWLLEHFASINLQDKNGYTALHFSAQEAHLEISNLLLDSGAALNHQDRHGNTAACHAIISWKGGKNFELLKSLVDRGADLKLKNKAGRSALEMIPRKIRIQLDIE